MKNIFNIILITLILSVNLFAVDLKISTLGETIYLKGIDPNIKVCELKQKINDKARVGFPEIHQRLINRADNKQMENNKKLNEYDLTPNEGYVRIAAVLWLFRGENAAEQKKNAEEDFKKCISAPSNNKEAAAAGAGAAS